jgi:hypothetical protein
MSNPEKLNLDQARRIIGVRVQTAGEILFCEAGLLSPLVGDWVMVGRDSAVFPAQVALPGSLLEAHQLNEPLPALLRMAGEGDLAAAGNPPVLQAQAAARFIHLVAVHNLPYRLKEVKYGHDAGPGLLAIRFSASQEPTRPDYVLLLRGLAETFAARLELFLVAEDAAVLNPPAGEDYAGWVNRLSPPLAPAVMARAQVGQPLLDETAIYRPGQRSTPAPPPPEPAAVYDPATATFSVGGTALALPAAGNN